MRKSVYTTLWQYEEAGKEIRRQEGHVAGDRTQYGGVHMEYVQKEQKLSANHAIFQTGLSRHHLLQSMIFIYMQIM